MSQPDDMEALIFYPDKMKTGRTLGYGKGGLNIEGHARRIKHIIVP